jgi:hypothetical protein
MQYRQQRADVLQRIESGVSLETSGRVRLRPLPGGRSPNSTGTLEFSITDETEFAEAQQQQCEGERPLTAAQPLSSSSDGFADSDGAGAASRGGFAAAAAAVVASITVATADSAAALLSSRSTGTAAAVVSSAVISVTSPRSPSRQVHPSSPCHSALSACSDAPQVTRHYTTLSVVSWLRDGGTAASFALLVALLALEITSISSISSCSGSGTVSDEQLQQQLQQQQRRRRARLALAAVIVVLQLVLLACAAVARRRSNTLSLKGERRLHPSSLNNGSSSSAAAYKVPAGAGAGGAAGSAGETPCENPISYHAISALLK